MRLENQFGSAYLKQTETDQLRKNKMSEVVHATDASFESEVLQSSLPVVLDFWAPWCGPCKMIAPILDEVAVELDGKVKVVKINVDENQQVAAKFGVRSIPTLVVFKEGKPAATQVGALPKNQLISLIEKAIA
ncbi:thioredoxin [Testudinibacter sp. TW-1]|uniref:thioredoxin n=1 Tax=Testudinibacter sp. TW-1 TaxID=3417757 RepID=UPI003D36E8A6